MEIDWEVEVGGGAPAIEALWAGFVDLRLHPERIGEIEEAAIFPPLGRMLLALNRADSGLWTAKCDYWRTDASEVALRDEGVSQGDVAVACYADILPVGGQVFSGLTQAEDCCRHWVRELRAVPQEHCRVDLVVRQAMAGAAEGFGITAYVGAWDRGEAEAKARLGDVLDTFVDRIQLSDPGERPAQSYNDRRRASSSIG